MINASIQLPGLRQTFGSQVRREIVSRIKKNLPKILGNIKIQTQEIFMNLVHSSEEYSSLLGGDLRFQIGLEDVSVVDGVLDVWKNNIEVRYTPSLGLGTISIGIIEEDYSDVLTSSFASYIYSSKSGPKTIEWLRWLLLEGSNTIVFDYNFTPFLTAYSRTGGGIMIKSRRGWKVPARAAGTATDNFITRALVPIYDELAGVAQNALLKGLS